MEARYLHSGYSCITQVNDLTPSLIFGLKTTSLSFSVQVADNDITYNIKCIETLKQGNYYANTSLGWE